MQPPKLIIDPYNVIRPVITYEEIRSTFFDTSIAVAPIGERTVVLRDTEQVMVLPGQHWEMSTWRHYLQTLIDVDIWPPF